MTWYNEVDPYAAAWLRNLIDSGDISAGEVDDRDIRDIRTEDIPRGTAHFFSGIGIWDLVLQEAGVHPGADVWTGSCPCQPFSQAGAGRGEDDPRHLWPVWAALIGQRKPTAIFGEQSASRAGREWLSAVRTDLEGMGYAVGAADLCAAGVGAPHVRQRLFWGAVRVGYTDCSGLEGYARHVVGQKGRPAEKRPTTMSGVWGDTETADCWDGKRRPVQRGIPPLVDGDPDRVGKIRAYGNAIVPQVGAVFVKSFLEALP